MENKRLEEIEAHVLAAQQELYDLCHGKQWRMCIPVQHGDSDIVFGVLIDDLQWLIAQLTEANNRSRDNMLAESQQQAKDDAAIAQRIETQLSTAGFPAIEDVYVSTNYSAYVTFEREPSDKHIKFAQNAFGLEIVRSDPRLRNRYRVTFKSPDREEA